MASQSSSKSSSTGTVILVVLGLLALGAAGGSFGDADTTTGADTTSDDDFSFEPDGGTTTGGLPACDDVVVAPAPGGGTVEVPAESTVFSPVTADCRVGEGSSDEAIAAVQEALSSCNGRPVSVDGDYGPETRGAVTDVQAANGLVADGTYGPATRQVMQWPGTAPSGEPTCRQSG